MRVSSERRDREESGKRNKADTPCGLLVNPGDTEALGNALICLITEAGLTSQFQTSAQRKFLDIYDVEKVTDQIIDVYKSVTSPMLRTFEA